MKKIEKLTEAQIARMSELRDKWLAISLSTEPADRPRCEEAIRSAYVAAGLKPPRKIVWCGSPLSQGLTRAVILNGLSDSVRASVRASVWDSVGASVRASVWDSVGAYCDADDAAWAHAWDQIGIRLPAQALTFVEVNKHVWWYYPGTKIVFASDRPTAIRRDDAGRLHSEAGMAIEFADGRGLSAWHGQTIPDDWVNGKPPSPAEALHWPNMDQRAAACEIVGWHNILDQLDARTINDSGDPLWGRLVEVSLPDSGRERFLDAICGTGRRFALPVPPDTASVDQAQSVLHGGLPPEILRFSVERT